MGRRDKDVRAASALDHVFQVGDRVEYFSSSSKKWIGGSVLGLNADGSYDLNVKKNAQARNVRSPVANENGAALVLKEAKSNHVGELPRNANTACGEGHRSPREGSGASRRIVTTPAEMYLRRVRAAEAVLSVSDCEESSAEDSVVVGSQPRSGGRERESAARRAVAALEASGVLSDLSDCETQPPASRPAAKACLPRSLSSSPLQRDRGAMRQRLTSDREPMLVASRSRSRSRSNLRRDRAPLQRKHRAVVAQGDRAQGAVRDASASGASDGELKRRRAFRRDVSPLQRRASGRQAPREDGAKQAKTMSLDELFAKGREPRERLRSQSRGRDRELAAPPPSGSPARVLRGDHRDASPQRGVTLPLRRSPVERMERRSSREPHRNRNARNPEPQTARSERRRMRPESQRARSQPRRASRERRRPSLERRRPVAERRSPLQRRQPERRRSRSALRRNRSRSRRKRSASRGRLDERAARRPLGSKRGGSRSPLGSGRQPAAGDGSSIAEILRLGAERASELARQAKNKPPPAPPPIPMMSWKALPAKPYGVPDAKPEKYSEELWEMPRSEKGLRLIGEEAPDVNWQYVLADDNRRSYAGFLKSPLTPQQCTAFFDAARSGTDWKQPIGPQGPIPRKTAWMVQANCTCSYRYGSVQVEPQPYPPWMIELLKVTMPRAGLNDPAQWPNCCNLNLYDDGGMSVGWHSDDEQLFQGKFLDVRIISLSFGVTRKFEMRANWPESHEKPVRLLSLGDGDMCTMEGMMQKHYQHRVPKEGNVKGARINLTWRWVVKHNPRCPAGRMRLG